MTSSDRRTLDFCLQITSPIILKRWSTFESGISELIFADFGQISNIFHFLAPQTQFQRRQTGWWGQASPIARKIMDFWPQNSILALKSPIFRTFHSLEAENLLFRVVAGWLKCPGVTFWPQARVEIVFWPDFELAN